MDGDEFARWVALQRVEVISHAVDRYPSCLLSFELPAQVAHRVDGIGADSCGLELAGDPSGQLPCLRFAGHVEQGSRNVEAAAPGLFHKTMGKELLTCCPEGIDAEADMARRDQEPSGAHLVADCFDITSQLPEMDTGR